MNLKGDLDSIGVAELFKTLSDQRATGVLTVSSGMGEKMIAVSHGEIAVVSDNLSERTRLGDLLVARGKITEEQLGHALKTQRLDARSKLGDILVKQGIASAELISEAIRFQVEEQITDLFTWKDASFEFDSSKSVDDVYDPDGSGSPIQRLSVSTQSLMAETAKRMESWKQIQDRIPTPYLCFKITPKGEELVGKSPKNTQTIVKFLKEGRTLETSIKKSCLGRFNVCTIVVKMLDDAWIFPIPGNELRFLASEHRYKKRFLDALYIYRRLLDTAQSETEKTELQKQVQDTIDAIHAAALSGDTAEGSEIVSYKDAAERYRRKQRVKRIALAVFGVSATVIVAYLLLTNLAPKATLSGDYTKSIKISDDLVAQHKYDDAIKIWHDFYMSVPDKASDSANAARERESAIIKMQDSYYDTLLSQGTTAFRANKWDVAEKAFQAILQDFSKPDKRKDADDGLARIKEARDAASSADKEKGQRERRKAALDLLQKKEYAAARIKLKEVADELGGSALRIEVDAGLKQIQDLEDKATALRDQARQEINNKQGERAIDTLALVYQDWKDVVGAEEARNLRQELKLNLEKLREMKKFAAQKEAEDNTVAALETFRQAERDYPNFEETGDIHKKVEELTGKLAGVEKELTEAKAVMASGDKARALQLYAALLKTQNTYLSVKNEKIPVAISSTPTGALIKLDGKEVGKTPSDVPIPVIGNVTLALELPGYAPQILAMKALNSEMLVQGFHVTLRRGALNQIKLAGPIFAPPRVIDGALFVFHGNTLASLDPECKQKPRDTDKLFDGEASARPNSSGNGETVPVMDKDWWCPRSAPEPLKQGQALLMLRSRDVLLLDTATLKTEKLISLPTEPIGKPHVESASLKGSDPIMAVGCADGKIYTYDLKTHEPLPGVKEFPADPRTNFKSSLATGLLTRNERTFVSLSTSGYLRCLYAFNGEQVWDPVDLGGELAPENVLPEGTENLAPFAMKDGRLVVVDINSHSKIVDYKTLPGEEVTRATIASDGIYVVNRKGAGLEIRKYDRQPASGKPNQIWGPHQLNSDTEIPLVVGAKAVFICTNDGNIIALDAKRGDRLWEFNTNNKPAKPSVMSTSGNLLYLGFPTGDLILLNAE